MRVGIIVVLGFACVFGWVSRGVGEDLRALVQAAARSSRDRLRSGIGKGVMRGYDKAGRKAYEMPFEAAFNGDKFNLKFDPKREDCGRSVIVSDTSAVSSREYFQGHGPDPVFVRGAGMLQSVQGYFPNEFFRFTAGALNPDQLDKYAVKIEKLSGGRLRGAYTTTQTVRKPCSRPRPKSPLTSPIWRATIVRQQADPGGRGISVGLGTEAFGTCARPNCAGSDAVRPRTVESGYTTNSTRTVS